jgi:poly(3-hydroxybutyrate) depolymerase
MKGLAGIVLSAACALAQPTRQAVTRTAAALALAALAVGGASLASPAEAQVLKKVALSIGSGMNASNRSYSYYVSSKANHNGYNLLVFALHDNGQTAEEFAQSSGWVKVAEDNGFVVVFPEAAKKTWSPYSGEEQAYLMAVYESASTHLTAAPGPNDPPPRPAAGGEGARGGNEGGGAGPMGIRIGTWQPWQYFTGAGAGAQVAQEFAIDNPGLVTAVATLDGAVYNATLAKGDETAQGYLEDQRGGKTAIPVYQPLKKDVPVPAWLFTSGAPTAQEAKLQAYWLHSDAVAPAADSKTIDGFQTAVYVNPRNASEQVRLTTVPTGTRYDGAMASAIWGFFSHVARWTSAPNGELGPMMTEPEVNQMFDVRQAQVGDLSYKYYVKTPSSYVKGKHLPMVISLHGFGYPDWMYLSQIRWQDVGEKEGFITVYLNGMQNHWDFSKPDGNDAHAIAQVIEDMAKAYGVDRSRVYLQGFSFGSGLTYTEGVTHPQLFAAVSPNDGIGDFSSSAQWVADLKAKHDIRIPMMVVYGAVDAASSNDGLIPAKGVLTDAINQMKAYDGVNTPDSTRPFDSPSGPSYDVLVPGGKLTQLDVNAHFPNGRYQKYDYATADTNRVIFSWVWVTDMPHGTAPGQAQLIWDFFKTWKRNPDGSLTYLGK